MDVFEFNHLDDAIALLIQAVNQGCEHAADDIMAAAQANCPVESGYLQSTIYVTTPDSDTYGQGVGSAPGDSYLLPEEAHDTDESVVGVGANYGAFVELGTRYMAPEPFLGPAAETVGAGFESSFDGVESFIAGGMP